MTDIPREFVQWGPRQRWRWIIRHEPVLVISAGILAGLAIGLLA